MSTEERISLAIKNIVSTMMERVMNKRSFTFIDLFSGIGGFRMALERVGGACLNFSEINPDAIQTYCTNFKEDTSQNLGDITQIKELPAHNLLTAGVPCQSWSIAGKNLGFDDDRGQLWNDTIYLLNQAKPDAFIFENVKGLVDPRNQKALDYILGRIKEAGYHASYYVLNSFDYGVPQNRIRIYIIGFREETFARKFIPPKPIEKKVKLADILSDFKNTKISTGLFGVNRVFLPSSNIFPTLVASDTNDFVTTQTVTAETEEGFKSNFIETVYKKENYQRRGLCNPRLSQRLPTSHKSRPMDETVGQQRFCSCNRGDRQVYFGNRRFWGGMLSGACALSLCEAPISFEKYSH